MIDMIDFTSLPSSKAEPFNGSSFLNRDFQFTFTESLDESKTYSVINQRLNELEASLSVDNGKLASLQQEVYSFRMTNDEKEEVLLRINWLRRLYEVEEKIQTVTTKEASVNLRETISSIHTCPLKNELITKLDSLVKTLPSEQKNQLQLSPEEELMKKAIEMGEDTFINLGKVGREHVIQTVVKQFGEKATVDEVQKAAVVLERKVKSLAGFSDPSVLIDLLEQLPLNNFIGLDSGRKEKIAVLLLELKEWNGLAALDRRILQLDRGITEAEQDAYERENTIKLQDGSVVAMSFNECYRE